VDLPEVRIDEGATATQREEAFREAVEISLKTGSDVLLRF
jgi:hypothetical protein